MKKITQLTEERFEQPAWCIKKITISGLKPKSAVINLFDPRTDSCGREFYVAQTGKKMEIIEQVRPGGWERHRC